MGCACSAWLLGPLLAAGGVLLKDEMGRFEKLEESFEAPLRKEREPSGDMVADSEGEKCRRASQKNVPEIFG